MTVVGMSGMAFTLPETSEVSPVKTQRPSSWSGVSEKPWCVGSRRPAKVVYQRLRRRKAV